MDPFVITDWPVADQRLATSPSELSQIVSSFVRQSFPSSLVTIGTGSAFQGRAGAYSDVDIIVINDGLRPAGRVQTIRDGLPLQVSIFDLAGCFKQIDIERAESRPFYLTALASSVFVDGNAGIHQLLAQYSKSVLASASDKADPRRMDRLKIAAVNKFLSVMSTNDKLVLTERIIDLINLVRKLTTLKAGRWGYTLDYLSDDNFDPAVKQAFDEIIEAIFRGDIEGAKAKAGQLMESAGLQSWTSPAGTILPLRVG